MATARVNIDHHVEFERHYYSVPYMLTGQVVEVRSALTTVEIFHRGERVSHVRGNRSYKATTVNEHRPKSHQQHLTWPPSRLLHWAQSVGACPTLRVANPWGPWTLFHAQDFEPQGFYNSSIPSKFISADGRKFWIFVASNFKHKQPVNYYGLTALPVSLDVETL